MSTTVSVGGFDVSSNTETSEAMLESLKPTEEGADEGTVLEEKGEKVDPEAAKVSKAASELGKRGGEAAAKARKEAEKKEARPAQSPASELGDEGDNTDAEGESDTKPLGKPRNDPRARVAEATRQAREARERLDAERQELARERAEKAQLRAELEEIRKGKAAPAPAPKRQEADSDPSDPEPQEADYDDYKKLIADTAAWATRREARAQEARRQEHERTQHFHKAYMDHHNGIWEKHMGRVAEAGGEDFLDGFDRDFLNTKMRLTVSLGKDEVAGPHNVIADEVARSEHGPGLMVFLRDNKDEFQRIASLGSPLDIAREMAKLEYRLGAATAGASSQTAVSKAKPPVKPVTGTPTAADSNDIDDDISFEEHAKRMNSRERGRAR